MAVFDAMLFVFFFYGVCVAIAGLSIALPAMYRERMEKSIMCDDKDEVIDVCFVCGLPVTHNPVRLLNGGKIHLTHVDCVIQVSFFQEK